MSQKRIKVVLSRNRSFEEDMKERDEAAKTISEIIAFGGGAIVTLHANLSDEEIRRAVARYKNIPVKFELVEFDSTSQDRDNFRARWKAAGGQEI